MKKFFLMLSCIVLTGCAADLPQEVLQDKSPVTKDINKNYDETWASLVEYLSSNNFQIKSTSKESGLITIEDAVILPNSYKVRCQKVRAIDDILPIHYNLNFLVKKKDNATTTIKINSRMIGVAHDVILSTFRPIGCVTTGDGEEKILNAISN